MRRLASLALLVATALASGLAGGGHEFPVYPSYYPHEIRIETMAPDRAAGLLASGKIQAYIGPEPQLTQAPPESIRPLESLGSLIVVRVNPESPRATDSASACALLDQAVRALAARHDGFVFHPYPVTPFDGDYLYHADLADAVRARFDAHAADKPHSSPPAVRAGSTFAKSLAPSAWLARGSAWDVAIEEVSAGDFAASSMASINGWIAPPWARSGWFRAAALLLPASRDALTKDALAADIQRLESGDFAGTVARINLERELVGKLVDNCYARVVGYAKKREYVNVEYSAGIENIGFDAITGIDSPIFVRTVKLKDFPWNGWLSIGIDSTPSSAWNPIAGFTDPFGRLMWYALGDSALLASPNGPGFMLNRISDVR
jgi:hypothetical protein